jgi:hypothetical protein
MSTQATSKFTIDSWDEHAYHETSGGGKLTRALVTQTFTTAKQRKVRGASSATLAPTSSKASPERENSARCSAARPR